MESLEATELINGLISEADVVRRDQNTFNAWHRKCRAVLDRIFGLDSRQSQDLMAVNFRFYGAYNLGDNTPHIRAFNSGLDTSKEVLRSIIWELERFGMPVEANANDPANALLNLDVICNRFHSIARQLRERHSSRPTLDVSDEYDVQDLLHALLRLHFDDVRAEEWTPSYAGSSTRMDFLLKSEQIVIEVKKTRKGLDAKKVGEELIIDIAHYQTHPNCKTLLCFVYDPENRIVNPAGLETDLSRKSDSFTVKVIISPKQ